MRTIILFNDNSPEAANAGEFALHLAQRVKADLLILNLCEVQQPKALTAELVGARAVKETGAFDMVSHLVDRIEDDDFRPVINEIDASNYDERAICELIISKNIWMMVKGIETRVTHEVLSGVDVQAVINHVACPLLLVPADYKKAVFEHITYVADMRYCRTAVLGFLAELAHNYDASLVVEHFSAKGLPHLSEDYARALFDTEVVQKIKYSKTYFNNIKERDLAIAVDVMIRDLHTDLLALVNHRYHFEELFGMSIKNVLPEHIAVPVIIFPQ